MGNCIEVQFKVFDTNGGPIVWQNIERKAAGSQVSKAVVALEPFTYFSTRFPGEVTTASPNTHFSLMLKKYFAASRSSSFSVKFGAIVF